MIGYLARRLVHAAPVWVGISLLAFSLLSLVPGDPAVIILQRQTGEYPSVEAVRLLRQELGLEDPLPVRYGRWLLHAAQGDLGRSYRTGEPVLAALVERFPRTLVLAVAGMAAALAVAVPLGVASALFRGGPLDHLARVGTLLLASLPSFWLAYLLILLLAVAVPLLPVAGWGGPRHLVLPALTLAVGTGAGFSRLVRATLLEELGQGYVRTARAKGLPGSAVTFHALRNSLLALVTLVVLRIGHLVGGAVIVETVFAWPGIGSFAVDAIFDRDYPAIQGFVLFTGTVFLLLNLVADLAYAWLDPRVRLDRGSARAPA